ncbi:Fe-S cluster assembly scaffold protein NifU [Sporomusa sp. KB1]|jgi:nitrogen fixation NifU-like protein|uniref:Fe-S cluster assembly scaffold protein NifU n=1 Tax=Sporomusa sp. KB1 TaxID=943346 RepID=UPI0011AAB415|nr:Fe-S cluster assembly scaffold protein NifU [Sporomusa sp. KB1]TWH48683.1 nitrogen fixation NifU-like protein [Sporomusa sp. KB1]
MYNDRVLDHFSNPRNVGEIEAADGIGSVGNPVDGDRITIYIKIKDNTLADVKFKTFGCAAAIAASSMVTVMTIGKTLKEALQIRNEDVAEALGGLPPNKLRCSNIAADALHQAIADYLNDEENKL